MPVVLALAGLLLPSGAELDIAGENPEVTSVF
ncbi:hypothetical protein FHX09_004765 [Rhizobium sp. BK538]|nr:hypothetical protein [Rhizobium sp. BK538]